MAIRDIAWYPYCVPLSQRFTTAHSAMVKRWGAIVEVFTDEGVSGLGEIAPLPEFGGGNLRDALTALRSLVEWLCGKSLEEALTVLCTHRAMPPSTAWGLEMALVDIQAQMRGWSLARFIVAREQGTLSSEAVGPLPHTRVMVNAVIGEPSIAMAVKRARAVVEAGFRCVKLKVGMNDPHADIERVAAVRAAIGSAPHLRLDANAAWSFQQAHTVLSACAQFDIQYIEQPLPVDELSEMRRLRQHVRIPIAVDEALHTLESAQRVLQQEAADIFIIKPPLSGSLDMSRTMIRLAEDHGVRCVVTSTMEAGIGVAGALHLVAASPEITLECGLATLHLLEDDLLLDELALRNGAMEVPTGAGLGVRLDREALPTYRTDEYRAL